MYAAKVSVPLDPPKVHSFLFLFLALLLALAMPTGRAQAAEPQTEDATQIIYLPAVQFDSKFAILGEESQVGFATATDRTLIRWYVTSSELPTAFNVYRKIGKEAETLVAEVTPVSDGTAATLLLNETNPAWPELADELIVQFADVGVTDIATLQAFLADDRFIAQQLANEYYPVALMIGWGYLDTEIKVGVETTYRVETVAENGKPSPLGTVTVLPGEITPLAKPAGLTAVNMQPGSSQHALPRDGEWAAVQRNRRFHQTVYLRWDQNSEIESPNGAWITGYDLYREGKPDDFQHISPREAIRPMPATQPISETTLITEATPYEEIDFYFADELSTPGSYTYRVAPRDLLGQVRQWPADADQFSDAATGRAYDFVPPPAPFGLVATPLADSSGVSLTWAMTPTADLDEIRIERTLRLNSPVAPDLCVSDADCWQEAVTLPANASEWVDNDATLESVRWYRVQAVDADGNRSYFAGPVQGVLHDITPPPPPNVFQETCFKPGRVCLGGGSNEPDVTRLRVACVFSPGGEEMLLDEIEGNNLAAYSIAENVYEAPIDLANLNCSVYAVDEHGNVSDPAPVLIPWFDSPLPPQVGQPVITQIETLGSAQDLSARVHWEITESPLIEAFRVQRTDILGATPPLDTMVGKGERQFDDDGVIPGNTYMYTVTADLTFDNGSKESLPKLYRATPDGLRTLQEFTLMPLTGDSNGILIRWDSCNVEGVTPPFGFAIYRSIFPDRDYQQITPIMPLSSCVMDYLDTNIDHTNYWYMVVQFNGRTGEAVAYTDAGQLPALPPIGALPPTYVQQEAMHSRLHNYVYQSSNGLSLLPCTDFSIGTVAPGAMLEFGGGFTLEIVEAAALHGVSLTGSGILHLTVNGSPLEVPVEFSNVTVGDAELHVCRSGSLYELSFSEFLGEPIEVTPADAMPYEVIGLTLLSWFGAGDQRPWGEIVIDLPDGILSLDHNGNTGGRLRLVGEALRLDNTLAFEYSVDTADLFGHSCDTPLYAWELETLPVRVVPTGELSITSAGISSTSGCMRYHDRYTGAFGPRPTPTDNNRGDANDGLLRANYTSSLVEIGALGLQGQFATSDDLSWIMAYPFGFNVNVTGDVSLTLAESRIASGTMGAGGVQMGYHQTLTSEDGQPFTATFAQATIDAGGAIYANVQTADDIAWLVPGGFRVDAGAWDWYAGALTTPGLPATVQDGIAQAVMFAPRPGAATPIDTISGIALPGELEPGLSRRINPDTLHWGNCCGPEVDFTAALDLYVRHGGVSGRFIAQLEESVSVPIYGYDGSLDHFEFAFLDNAVWDSNVTGNINLPFPSNINIRLVDMWLADDGCGACLGGGIVPPDQRQFTLEYWQVHVELHSVEFHPDAPGPEPVCEKLLVANGNITVPHLAIPGMSAPTVLDTELVFLPDGMAVPHILAYSRGDYLFDGFPYLLEGMRLSEVGENADWHSDATLANPPSVNWDQTGFVELDGAFVARYFGPLQGQTAGPDNRPKVRFLAADGGYSGTDQKAVAEKTWVDLAIASIGLRYEMTAFPSQNEMHFVAARTYQFLPDNYLDLLPDQEVAEQLRIVYLDTSVILEPQGIDIFAGLSSGVAALRSLAEANGGALPAEDVAAAWSAKIGLNEAGQYYSLLNSVWSSYGGADFHDTTNALDSYDDQPNQSLPDDDGFGGGTGGFLAEVGAKFKRIRGDIQFIDADDPGRIQLDHFQLSTQVDIQRSEEAGSMLYIERMSFEINRHGDYILEAIGATSKLYASNLTIDATLRINVQPETRQFEGGLTLYSFNISTVKVIEGSAVLGVGKQANFVGATFLGSASSGPSGGSVAMGGSFLVGTIDPSSPVLQNHFGEVVSKLAEVPASPDDDTPATQMSGLYLRMYGDTTLWNDGGILQLNAGAEIAVWLWVHNIGEHIEIPNEVSDITHLLNFVTFGGKYRFFIHGKILHIISARGDLSMIYWDRPGDIDPSSEGIEAILNDVINRKRSLTGIAWVAGGLGFCDAATWTSWESRWWGDKWCWTAGAYLEVEVSLTGVNPGTLDIDADWDADYEGS